jgi:hypothetical protein
MCNFLSQLLHVNHCLKQCLRLRLVLVGLSIAIVGCNNKQTAPVSNSEATTTTNSTSISSSKTELTTNTSLNATAGAPATRPVNRPLRLKPIFTNKLRQSYGVECPIYRNGEEAGEASIRRITGRRRGRIVTMTTMLYPDLVLSPEAA